MAKQNNQIQALQMAAQTKRQQALNKVKKALVDMKENALPINIGTVAKLAGVSRTWLYNNTELRDEIQQHCWETGKIQRIIDLQQLVETRDRKIAHLKHRNQQQKTIIKKLRRQLEVVYGELYKTRKN